MDSPFNCGEVDLRDKLIKTITCVISKNAPNAVVGIKFSFHNYNDVYEIRASAPVNKNVGETVIEMGKEDKLIGLSVNTNES